ncbi:hypothetical protein [Crenobacter cavernae]|uniref:IS481 family transposase n=1 Tax=Crenobacter cavernae TaxID=2290923 RepID=A0ABY0FE66_9NEIS|nr:hypothetical protein [Crenobacter cavernae]RXZ44528.1 hypothetical protein EBB06_05355 [Crenobacter cavernae]
MIVRLHRQARTTPAIRAEIQAATGTHVELAARYHVSASTIAKWCRRQSVDDRSHTAHRLQTTLTPAQERIAVELRKLLKLGLDDLLVVVREFLNPAVSRAGLGHCLARHGAGKLRDLEPTVLSPRGQPFNGRIAEVLATHRFHSGEDLVQTLERYVWLYNQHLPQRALQHRTPLQAMKDRQKQRPELFVKRVSNRPGLGH